MDCCEENVNLTFTDLLIAYDGRGVREVSDCIPDMPVRRQDVASPFPVPSLCRIAAVATDQLWK